MHVIQTLDSQPQFTGQLKALQFQSSHKCMSTPQVKRFITMFTKYNGVLLCCIYATEIQHALLILTAEVQLIDNQMLPS